MSSAGHDAAAEGASGDANKGRGNDLILSEENQQKTCGLDSDNGCLQGCSSAIL